MMAEAAVDSVDCLLCSEECVEPLTLGCEHRFCSNCLREHWAPSLTGDCPKCNRRWSKVYPPDFSLERDLGQSKAETWGEIETEGRKHHEQSPESPSDEPSVSQEAFSKEEPRERHKSEINKLKAKKERTEDVMKQYKSMLEHTEGQRLQGEAQVRAQFRRFHEFLLQEEELHLNNLRKEQQEKTQIIEKELKKLQDELGSVSDRICSAEQQLQEQSTESSSLKEHMESLVLTDEPQLRSGLLIDQATVLGNLGYKAWKKMRTIVSFSPVILDPNTASGELCVSEDLTSVRQRDTPNLQVPRNPERFTKYPSVLGSMGFSSGFHRWEVEVGDNSHWVVGLAKKTINRRDHCVFLPIDGFWCLMYHQKKYSDVVGNNLELKRRPEKIRVELDFYTGKVSFFDTREMNLICTYSDTFTEIVYPYFSVGKAGDPNVTKDIKICHKSVKGVTTWKSSTRTPTSQMAQGLIVSDLVSRPKQTPAASTKKDPLVSKSDPTPKSATKEKTPKNKKIKSSGKFKFLSSQNPSSQPEPSTQSTEKKPQSLFQQRKMELKTEPSKRTEEN